MIKFPLTIPAATETTAGHFVATLAAEQPFPLNFSRATLSSSDHYFLVPLEKSQ